MTQDLSFKVQTLEDELENKNRLSDLRSMEVSSAMKSSTSRSIDTEEIFISVANFVENTIALFIYRNPTTYIAFNVHCPHRYLSQVRCHSLKKSSIIVLTCAGVSEYHETIKGEVPRFFNRTSDILREKNSDC